MEEIERKDHDSKSTSDGTTSTYEHEKDDHEDNTTDYNGHTSTTMTSPDRMSSSIADESIASSSNVSDNFLNPNSTLDEADAIVLLKQIFPEESTPSLRTLHNQRLQYNLQARQLDQEQQSCIQQENIQQQQGAGGPSSPLGKRLWKEASQRNHSQQINATNDRNRIWNPVTLPEDFLRLPTSVSDRRSYLSNQNDDDNNKDDNKEEEEDIIRYEFLSDLHARVVQEFLMSFLQSSAQPYHHYHDHDDNHDDNNVVMLESKPTTTTMSIQQTTGQPYMQFLYTVVIFRHQTVGLGLTLSVRSILSNNQHTNNYDAFQQEPQQEQKQVQQIYVHGLVEHVENPSKKVEPVIQPGDVLLGLNGSMFSLDYTNNDETDTSFGLSSSPSSSVLPQAVQAIQMSQDPVVLHFGRSLVFDSIPNQNVLLSPTVERNCSLLDSTFYPEEDNETDNELYQNERQEQQQQQQQTNYQRRHVHLSSSQGLSLPVFNDSTPPYTVTTTTDNDLQTNNIDTASTTNNTTPSVPPPSIHRPLDTPHSRFTLPPPAPPPPYKYHPLAKALIQRGLIRGQADAQRITEHLHQFTIRTHQWETWQVLRLHTKTQQLLWQESNNEDVNIHGRTMTCPPSTPSLYAMPYTTSNDHHGHDHHHHHYDSNNNAPPHPTSAGRSTTTASPWTASYPGNGRRRPSPIVPTQHQQDHQYLLLPLYNIRQALSCRIVHSFVDTAKDMTTTPPSSQHCVVAYTIWVYDVETTKEWYAPIRYDQDFQELRQACLALAPKSMGIDEWEFPHANNNNRRKRSLLTRRPGWLFNRNNNNNNKNNTVGQKSPSRMHINTNSTPDGTTTAEDESSSLYHCHLLEHFLRKLCSLVYTCDPLVPEIAELAIHVQSFLGVEAGLAEEYEWDSSETILASTRLLSSGSSPVHRGSSNDGDDDDDDEQNDEWNKSPRPMSMSKHDTLSKKDASIRVRQELKQSLQRYTYRVFLLNVMTAIVQDFVDTTRQHGPKLEDIESLQVHATLQSRARQDLEQLQRFLDQLVDLILDGCGDDLRQVAEHEYYAPCHAEVLADDSAWERLVREAVREQVEIEVYVPLRSVVSRLLVNGWRHEDMQVQFKFRELRRRPQSAFRIPLDKQSPSHWQSVATILKKGVGMSTLPGVKLRAIVDAAREITRLYEREHHQSDQQALGADDFLPIFIFCVVRADMERPCALCMLLQTLCDKMNRIGEIGYYLASFEAAIAHITDLDLTDNDGNDDDDDALSFLTEPLTDVSLS